MIERNIKLKNGVKQVMSDIVQAKYVITPDDMYKMNTLVDLLRHFKATTDILSGQNIKMKSNFEITPEDSGVTLIFRPCL